MPKIVFAFNVDKHYIAVCQINRLPVKLRYSNTLRKKWLYQFVIAA